MNKHKRFLTLDFENPFDFFHSQQDAGFPVLYRITNRFILFLFLQSLALGLFFFVGNYQGFLDLTLQVILLLHSLCCIALFFASIFAMAQYILFMKLNRYKLRASYIIIYIFLLIYSSIATLFSLLVNFVSRGM